MTPGWPDHITKQSDLELFLNCLRMKKNHCDYRFILSTESDNSVVLYKDLTNAERKHLKKQKISTAHSERKHVSSLLQEKGTPGL